MAADSLLWRGFWTAAGVQTLPLWPGRDKRAVCAGWPDRGPAELWAEAEAHPRRPAGGYNIGCKCGRLADGTALVVVDCDEPATVANVRAGLKGLGLRAVPTVQTASGTGRHFYLRATGAPDGSYNPLAQAVGAGELRFGRAAYVVAPCSEIDGRVYRFTVGGPEQVTGQRPVAWRDLQWLVAQPLPAPARSSEGGPAALLPPLLKRDIPRQAAALLARLGTAGKSKPISSRNCWGEVVVYLTRSEAEAGVVGMLILAGWTLEEIGAVFQTWQPGHYAEAGKQAERYLARTYKAVLGELASEPTRLELAAAYRQAEVRPWLGRTAELDRAVYLGLLSEGWRWATWQPYAATRDLASYAAASVAAVHAALGRLRLAGLAWPSGTHPTLGTTQYTLRCGFPEHESQNSQGEGARWPCGVAGEGPAELWSVVGRTAGTVWRWLGDRPARVADLARAAELDRGTVAAALRRLEAHGLAVLAEDGRGWVRGPAMLEEVVDRLGAAALARQRRAAHREEREIWRDLLAAGRVLDLRAAVPSALAGGATGDGA